MEFQDAVRTCLSKYADFNGRARRSEFWWFVLFGFLGSLALGLLDALFGIGLFQTLWGLALLLPSLAVGARRLHDIGKSGWWQLINLIPVIGLILLIYWYVQPGTEGANSFGAEPDGPVGST